jgi:hypothetical protein
VTTKQAAARARLVRACGAPFTSLNRMFLSIVYAEPKHRHVASMRRELRKLRKHVRELAGAIKAWERA